MKSQLSHLLPISKACGILGEDRVSRIVYSLLSIQQQQQQQQQQHVSSSTVQQPPNLLHEETQALVQSMLYTTNADTTTATASTLEQIPPPIRASWKRLASRTCMLDKMAWLKFCVPACAQPHAGPGGHMGLFDCLAYSLQQKPGGPIPTGTSNTLLNNHNGNNNGNNNMNGNNNNNSSALISIPDLIIFLAICQAYSNLQNPHASDKCDSIASFSNQDPVIIHMAQWMFLVYDSYQKKGVLTRDTLHRFLSDVHGEESYKTPAIRELLSRVFRDTPNLTSREFTKAIQETMIMEPQPTHWLLDWMALLADAIVPSSQVPDSTQQFLKTITQELQWLNSVCTQYALTENRLYEIKRRFHSLVEARHAVIQGDPMRQGSGDVDDGTVGAAGGTGDVDNGNGVGGRKILPKHVITKGAFERAVCQPNEELGHSGYLPPSLASTLFEKVANQSNAVEPFWDLTQVLQFGGMAVRSPHDTSLVQWMLQLFTTSKKIDILERHQVGHLLRALSDHYTFRMQADAPPREEPEQEENSSDKDNGNDNGNDNDNDNGNTETCVDMVDVATASLLGLLPKKMDTSITKNGGNSTPQVAMSVLIDTLLQEVQSEDGTLSVPQLLKWHNNVDTELPRDQRRLGPLLMEFRLIASVLFGVPPKHASMEFAVVTELQRRHKYRYPQTDVSRRGPRGTVWYIIDDLWFKTWSSLVEKVSKTADDGQDLRDEPSAEVTPRRLGRISNKGLLQENGSLALRIQLKWRHDYEIIPPLAWSALQAWYDGGPPIHRTVVPYIPTHGAASPHVRAAPRIRTENEIELYPSFVTVFMCDATSRGEARPFQQKVPVSRVSPVRVLLVQLCKGLDMDPKFGRLWVMDSAPAATPTATAADGSTDTLGDWVLDLDATIVEQRRSKMVSSEEGGNSTITLLLELKDEETGLWPRGIDGKQWAFREKSDRTGSETGDGIVGLYNMGNTCYLNSSIQCLSHTPIFRDYFTSKCYLNDINTTNPLGHQGRLAQVSAVLINSLWKRFNQQQPHQPKRVTAPGSYAPVNAPALTPKTFKDSLGKFNDHFAGNEQHDAQELLAFLLGGLSEDLNQIVDKPYIEAPDSDGRPDSELADIWWSNHLKREMSIIVALFTGQYKSLLTCRSCKYESARFEPFSFLQLPLPEDDNIPVSLILYPLKQGAETMKYSVRVHNNGKLQDVLVALAKILHADEQAETSGGGEDNGEAKSPLSENLEEEEKAKLQTEYECRAQNMAVVDMREGYIFKIAPNSWSLPDLQNKDTGELPLLHVYELDPLPLENDFDGCEPVFSEEDKDVAVATNTSEGDDSAVEKNPDDKMDTRSMDSADEDDSSEEGKASKTRQKYSFLAVAQRRSEQMAKDILHPLAHRVFGTPLLLRVVELEGLTGHGIYDLVSKRLRNFVPRAALLFLENKNGTSDSVEVSMTPQEGEDGASPPGTRQRLSKTTTDMEDVAAGAVPRYGFRLRITSRDGRRCALCPWYECCIGCMVPDNDKPTVVMCGDSIVIDWHFAVDVATAGFGTRSNHVEQASQQASPFRSRAPGVSVKNHSSCGVGAKKKGYAGAITLEDCLDAFAQEEKIPEAYCSKCQDFRVQTKRMSLWRLPPVVIIQLKRFQFTQHMRRKLRDFVVFPVEGLDLSRIMTADEGVKPEREVNDESPIAEENTEEDSKENDEENPSDEKQSENGDDTMSEESAGSPLNSQDNGRTEMLYDLYGVVHHQGALSGGHYVASLKSELDGQWRLFNDAQVYEIHNRDVVDSSAYILFYIRRDVANAKLSDFWDTSAREGEGLTEEDMDKLIRGRSDRCVIS